MKINTFDLEKKLHALNQALLYEMTGVEINFTERPEDRSYQCTFTQEFLEDINSKISESSEDVYVFITFTRAGLEDEIDILICDEKTNYDNVFDSFAISKATPLGYHTTRTDNYLDVELLRKMLIAAHTSNRCQFLLDRYKPIELFPYYKKVVDPPSQS